MKHSLPFLILLTSLSSSFAWANTQKLQQDSVSGNWIATYDLYGYAYYMRLDLERQGEDVIGKLGNTKLSGTTKNGVFHLHSVDDGGRKEVADGSVVDGVLKGVIVDTDLDNNKHSQTYQFIAIVAQKRPTNPPKLYEFSPTYFYRDFSSLNKPVLTIAPGDTVHTSTLDAGGANASGVKQVLGGNPQTGPFYVISAMPGDTLVVHIRRLTLNRDYAVSDDLLVDSALNSNLAVKMKDGGKTVIWRLDAARGVASIEAPGPHTKDFHVPLNPMLGCIAAAPLATWGVPNARDSGSYGGNIDFNGLVEGTTVYLPVSVPGALLYLGDGHAAQGDGELNGNALETSLDVEFSVDVIPRRHTPSPRAESSTQIMALGLGGSIDDALREATSNMSQWLSDDYKLNPTEIAEVLGSSAQYQVNEVADRNAGVVLKLNKAVLTLLNRSGE